MSGLLRRIRRAHPTAPDPAPEAANGRVEDGVPARTDTAPDAGREPLPADGAELDKLVGARPATRRRSRVRRRLRHLRAVRELLLRDLGGLVYEIHRSGTAGEETPSRLVAAKLARLTTLDGELHELQTVLHDHRGPVVREPGIGGACPQCGELFGSDARFCWACGTPVAPGASRPPLETSLERLPVLEAPVADDPGPRVWADDATQPTDVLPQEPRR